MEILTDRMPRLGGSSRLSLAGPPQSANVPGCRYRLLEEIAHGGMGVVHRAVDTLFEREVALKLIHEKHAGDDSVRLRFHEEARITARLQHPGIPPVHDQGVLPDGRLFLAMKWIQGRTLSNLLEEDDPPAGRKLAIFEGVCQAVGYAHSKGIIHRDLKPSNVMVGAFGEVQVMDWGLGKVMVGEMAIEATANTREAETQAGSAIGTFAYMPPEQAKGDRALIGPASDVFGLGAVLCHLLTGDAPYRGSAAEPTSGLAAAGKLDDALKRIAACDAEADLKAICRKCLAVDPQDRYPDAGALARTVGLLRQSTEERARRAEVAAARGRERRKLWIGLSAMLLLGTSVAGWLAIRERDARRNEAAQKVTAQGERDRALAARNRTRTVLDSMTSFVTIDNLTRQRELTAEQQAFLNGALDYYREFAGEDPEDGQSRRDIAETGYRVALIEYRLGRREKAAALLEGTVAAFDRLLSEFPGDERLRSDQSTTLNHLGLALNQLGRRDEARRSYERSRELLLGLMAAFPKRWDYRDSLSKTDNNLANFFDDAGMVKEALALHGEALALREANLQLMPDDPDRRNDVALTLANRACTLRAMGQDDKAETDYRKAVAIQEKVVADYPVQPDYKFGLTSSLDSLGQLLVSKGRQPDAAEVHRRASTILADLVAQFPSMPMYRADLARSQSNLGVALMQSGERPRAESAYRDAMAIQAKLAADFPKTLEHQIDLGGSYCNFGVLVRNGGRLEESLQWHAKAIETLEPVCKSAPGDAAAKRFLRNSHFSRARTLEGLERFGEALTDYDRALALCEPMEQAKIIELRDACRAKAGK